MRICFMTHSVHPTMGGTTKYFFEVTQKLKSQGHHVTLVCTGEVSSKNIDVDDLILVRQFPIWGFKYLVQTMFFGLLAFLKVRRKKFDVYCFESGYIGIWLALFKLTKREPFISFSMRYGWKMLKISLKNKYFYQSLMTFHDILRSIRYVLWETVFFIYEVLDVHLSDKIIVLNNEAKKVWTDSGITRTKIDVIPYGVDLTIYKPLNKDQRLLTEFVIGQNDKIILYVGHLDAIRNFNRLIYAFSILSERWRSSQMQGTLRLLVVGSGSAERTFKHLVTKIGLDEVVRFVPHIHDEARLNRIYNLGDFFVLPQIPGTTALLAMACGLPVVTIKNSKSDCQGYIEENILNGFVLLDSADPKIISEACWQLLQDPEKLDDISQKGLKIISDYSWENVAAQVSKLLTQLVVDDASVN
jgi:glycosyltransferase involved in cell wall biosynthesis